MDAHPSFDVCMFVDHFFIKCLANADLAGPALSTCILPCMTEYGSTDFCAISQCVKLYQVGEGHQAPTSVVVKRCYDCPWATITIFDLSLLVNVGSRLILSQNLDQSRPALSALADGGFPRAQAMGLFQPLPFENKQEFSFKKNALIASQSCHV